MKLKTASNVCEKINENAAYAFLFAPEYVNWNDKADKFIEKFADEHGLQVTTVAPGTWTFTHEVYGQLNDGLIELDKKQSIPVFRTRDVSEAKITSNSPDFDLDLETINHRMRDAKIEYIRKLKGVIAISKEALDDLSTNLNGTSKVVQMKPDIDAELEDLQNRYHLAMDRLKEIQGSTEENYETLKSKLEMSLISLKHSIDEAASKFNLKS